MAVTDAEGATSYHLLHRNGQMNILEDKSQPNRLIITMNEMNGGCYTIPATVKGDSIVFLPYEFSTNILISDSSPGLFSGDNTLSIVYAIRASGGGHLNDDILMVDEQWEGHQSGNDAVLLNGPKMKIIAERN